MTDPATSATAAAGAPQPGRPGLRRLRQTYGRAGAYYTALYAVRRLVHGALQFLDRRLVAVEQAKGLVEPWCISARRWTVQENKQLWNTYDWSQRGEEWTRDAAWKEAIVNNFLIPNIPQGGVILEIGPGGGRWTEVLRSRAAKVVAVDVSERAILLCRERFAGVPNVQFVLGDGWSLPVDDASIDGIWSYDVFVHISPVDVKNYFREFSRILKPGARAVIHHPGEPLPGGREREGWRSDLTDGMVHSFARENGLRRLVRADGVANKTDYVSVFEKPAGVTAAAPHVPGQAVAACSDG
jgi:ubiquinone/menaquinone biosynthesis C-methylase UbiE